ncbi:MAG TPA: Gfo/Idh/MocA family oxidoreductase [Clostridiales bacterium]|nr:Gfo/Idh/MocA family oxidoreductase [Clostridiales bacterium]
MKKKRVGIVGLGFIAKGVHLPGISKSPDLELTAICDIDAGALEAVQKAYGIDDAHCFTDYRDLIACEDVDVVDICVPNDVHYPVALCAIEMGKPYNLEKPVGLDKAEADTLAALTKEKELPNMVCFSYRFKAASRYARDLVLSGALGDIYHANMQYFQAWGIPYQDIPLLWFFTKEHAGSGVLGDLGSHGVDLVRFITGKEYQRVIGNQKTFVRERRKKDGSGMCKVDVDDSSYFMADMEGGLSASFLITRFAYGRSNYQRLEIYGSKGALIYKLDETPGVDELEVCIGEPYASTHTYTKVQIPDKYHVDQMQSLADILLGKGDGLSANIYDGQRDQYVLDAVIESSATGRWVTL